MWLSACAKEEGFLTPGHPSVVFNSRVLILLVNKAGCTATPVACGWARAIIEVSGAFGQAQQGQKPHRRQKSKV